VGYATGSGFKAMEAKAATACAQGANATYVLPSCPVA